MLDGLRQNAGSWIIKILFGIIILAFVFAYGSGSMNSGGGAVLAYVGESPILIKDFQDAYRREVESIRQQMPDLSSDDIKRLQLKDRVLSNLVNSMLIDMKAKELGLSVSDAELQQRVASFQVFRNKEGRFDQQMYRNLLGSNGMSPAQFEESQRRSIKAEKLQKYVSGTVIVTEAEARDFFRFANEQIALEYIPFKWESFKDNVTPSETEITKYYEDNQDRFRRPAMMHLEYIKFTPQALAAAQKVTDAEVKAYYEANKDSLRHEEEVKARHILIKLDADAGDKAVADARAKLLKLKARIAKGAKFADIAAKYSDGPSKAQGGDLGWFGRGAMVGPFEEAAFNLKPGGISAPVRTKFGLHLIKVEDYRPEGVLTFKDAAPEIRRSIAGDKAANALSDELDRGLAQVIAGDSLKKVADDMDMTLETIGPVTKQALMQRLGIDADSADSLFLSETGKAYDAPIVFEDGYILASKKAFMEENVRPMDEVKSSIVEALKREGGMDLAKEKAATVLADLKDPEKADQILSEYKQQREVTTAFNRRGVIPGVGMNPSLVEEAFASTGNDWLPQPFAVGEGFIVTRVAKRVAPPEASWEQQKPLLMAQLRQNKQREAIMAYLGDLREQVKVEIVEPSVME